MSAGEVLVIWGVGCVVASVFLGAFTEPYSNRREDGAIAVVLWPIAIVFGFCWLICRGAMLFGERIRGGKW